jgi:hypothetical protein
LIFANNDVPFVKGFCAAVDVSSSEAVARDLVWMFEKYNKVVDLISTVIVHEVNQTINEGTLFRKNSLSSQLMTQYSHLIGREYLHTTLAPLIQNIIKANTSYEVSCSAFTRIIISL